MMNNKAPARPTIGLIIPQFWTGSSFPLYRGIKDALEKYQANLLCFQGYYISDRPESIAELGNVVYDLVKRERLNGVIIRTGSIKNHQQKLKLLEFCRGYHPLPMVSIGSAIEGLPNILVDNYNGMHEMATHLIQVHGYRKICFIRGPEDNQDANIRYQAYLDVLQEQAIDFNPDLVSPPGVWNFEWGVTATRAILKKVNNRLEAIIASSDEIARGVIKELTAQGIDIPDKVGVVGFNDNRHAYASIAPLTTVNINLYERAWKAIEIIFDSFDGKPLPKEITVPSIFVIRQSCGCPSAGVRAVEIAQRTKLSGLFKGKKPKVLEQEKLKQEVLKAFEQQVNEQLIIWIEKFVDSFLRQLQNPAKGTFIPQFEALLHQFALTGCDLSRWHWALNVLARESENVLTGDENDQIQHILQLARVVLGEVATNEQKHFLMLVEERNATIHDISNRFSNIYDLEKIIEFLAIELPRLGIPACYLSLYENPETPAGSARLLLAYNEQGRLPLPSGGLVFPSTRLIPDGLISEEQRNTLILEPLFYGENQLGFTLFKISSLERSFYELFPTQLSSTLWKAILLNKEKQVEALLYKQTQDLARSNLELTERATELEKAYQQLQDNQHRLLISEKMASLGRLTAGIAHEINSPLAAVRASLTELKQLIREYEQSIRDPEIEPADHLDIIKEMHVSADLANKASERAASFIRSIKAQTRDINEKEGQLFDIVQVIDSVLFLLGHSLKKNHCQTDVICLHKEIIMCGSPGKMTQVFTNLLTNAIDAMETKGGGKIVVALELTNDNNLIITVSDEGCGIPQENMLKIFDPLFTTKPFGQGTGLGLMIVHDIVCGEFGGALEVKSQVGAGTTFTLRFQAREGVKQDGTQI
jgi:signal transduction histidine kinase/DNA-binding LacI/PurR family transcriptional regulator